MDHSEDSRGSGRQAGGRIHASKEQEDIKELFVGGLAKDTTQEKLQAYFSKFGTVVDCIIKKDQITKISRGFGFVLFESADSVTKVLEVSRHKLDNKIIDPKLANPFIKRERKKQIFIGGIGSDLEDEQITEYFSKFGTVVETEFPEGKNTGRRLGFAFLKYETSDEAQDAMKQRFHTIANKKVEVREAVSREERQQQKMREDIGRGDDSIILDSYINTMQASSVATMAAPPETPQDQEIGIRISDFEKFFLFLGVVFLFDYGLLVLLNILFLYRLVYFNGRGRTLEFFFQLHKLKGTVFFLGGIIINFLPRIGMPLAGIIIEIYGFFVLFE